MIEYRKYKCDKCGSNNTEYAEWEDEYSKKSMFTCFNCNYVVGKQHMKLKR